MGWAILCMYRYCFGWYHLQTAVFCVLCEKGYEQGTCLCDNLNFRLEIEYRCCNVFFSIVFFKKKLVTHILLHSEELVIYTFIGHNLTSIDVMCA